MDNNKANIKGCEQLAYNFNELLFDKIKDIIEGKVVPEFLSADQIVIPVSDNDNDSVFFISKDKIYVTAPG